MHIVWIHTNPLIIYPLNPHIGADDIVVSMFGATDRKLCDVGLRVTACDVINPRRFRNFLGHKSGLWFISNVGHGLDVKFRSYFIIPYDSGNDELAMIGSKMVKLI